MFQSLVEGREVPRALLVKDIPPEKHFDLDFIVSELDWEANVDPNFKENHYLEPVPVARYPMREGYIDRWIVYGKINGEQLFTAKELTLEPGTKCTIRDNGAYGLIVVQGSGKNQQPQSGLPQADPVHRIDGRRSFLYGIGCEIGRGV